MIKKSDQKRKKAIRKNRNDNEIKAVREDDQKQKRLSAGTVNLK